MPSAHPTSDPIQANTQTDKILSRGEGACFHVTHSPNQCIICRRFPQQKKKRGKNTQQPTTYLPTYLPTASEENRKHTHHVYVKKRNVTIQNPSPPPPSLSAPSRRTPLPCPVHPPTRSTTARRTKLLLQRCARRQPTLENRIGSEYLFYL